MSNMEKKLITEMKFMMERLENPRMTYTQYERKRNNLIKEDEDGKESEKPMIPKKPSTKGLPEKPSKKSPFLKPEVEPELPELKENGEHKKPKLYQLTSFSDFITTLVKKVNPNHMFDLKKLERMFNDGGNSATLYSPGFMNRENTIFKLGNGDLYELTPDTDINSPVSGKTVVSPTKINQLPSWAIETDN